MVHLARAAENRSAELHATLYDTRSIVADNPLECVVCEYFGCLRAWIEERYLVETKADFGVGGVRKVVELAEVFDMRSWERSVRLKAFKEHD